MLGGLVGASSARCPRGGFYLWVPAPDGDAWAFTERRRRGVGRAREPGRVLRRAGRPRAGGRGPARRPHRARRPEALIDARVACAGWQTSRRRSKSSGSAEARSSRATSRRRKIVREAVDLLDTGQARVAEVVAGRVVVHVAEAGDPAALPRCRKIKTVELGPFEYADKMPLKTGFKKLGVRVVPGASARYGSFLERGVVLMPSYVNIGAHVGHNTMVDTWATVGSCAQIGANVHLSGGVGIGGVLEPPQAAPVIVEDDCLIGSRCIVAEGARVGAAACSAPGCILTGSIPVIDAQTGAEVGRGTVPPHCVAVTATRPAQVRQSRVRPAVRPRDQAPARGRAPRQGAARDDPARPRRDGVTRAPVADLLALTAELVDIPSVSHDEAAITDHAQSGARAGAVARASTGRRQPRRPHAARASDPAGPRRPHRHRAGQRQRRPGSTATRSGAAARPT